jgi:hypothetical protein
VARDRLLYHIEPALDLLARDRDEPRQPEREPPALLVPELAGQRQALLREGSCSVVVGV